jgi:hypothetical protein
MHTKKEQQRFVIPMSPEQVNRVRSIKIAEIKLLKAKVTLDLRALLKSES